MYVRIHISGTAEYAMKDVTAGTLIGSGAQTRSWSKLLPAKTDARNPQAHNFATTVSEWSSIVLILTGAKTDFDHSLINVIENSAGAKCYS